MVLLLRSEMNTKNKNKKSFRQIMIEKQNPNLTQEERFDKFRNGLFCKICKMTEEERIENDKQNKLKWGK